MSRWEYFVLRKSENNYGETVYYKGESQDVVCPAGTPEVTVLNTLGQHRYELVSVMTTRMGATKYFFKRSST